jgi:hypothetical protein
MAGRGKTRAAPPPEPVKTRRKAKAKAERHPIAGLLVAGVLAVGACWVTATLDHPATSKIPLILLGLALLIGGMVAAGGMGGMAGVLVWTLAVLPTAYAATDADRTAAVGKAMADLGGALPHGKDAPAPKCKAGQVVNAKGICAKKPRS